MINTFLKVEQVSDFNYIAKVALKNCLKITF